jgi:hypothetical protein
VCGGELSRRGRLRGRSGGTGEHEEEKCDEKVSRKCGRMRIKKVVGGW